MRAIRTKLLLTGIICAWLLSAPFAYPLAGANSEVPAGTRFMVELGDKLDARKVNRGKKFKAWTLEAIEATNGRIIPEGTKLTGWVSYATNRDLQLRFDRIETEWGKLPIVATVTGVEGEKGVKRDASDEGDIKASGGRGKSAAIDAVVGGGIGAGVGGAESGRKGAAIRGGTGALAGALIGAAAGGHDLVLYKGTQIEVQLERLLILER